MSREVRTTDFVPRWARGLTREEWAAMPDLECHGVPDPEPDPGELPQILDAVRMLRRHGYTVTPPETTI